MYVGYLNTLRGITSKQDPFKRDSEYIGILEHVSLGFGEAYLDLLRSEFAMTNETVEAFCDQNDSFGSPNVFPIRDLARPVSPTSLRYLYHASLILKHAKGADRFVEVGAGYGGLCMAIQYLSKTPVREYHVLDLDEAVRLQQMVLAEYTNVHYHSSSTFGANVPEGCFFVSNYCFSEIAMDLQRQYISNLIVRCEHGFLAWNTIPCYDIGKPSTVEDERPLTFGGNYFVYF